jgi:hypothetical protein
MDVHWGGPLFRGKKRVGSALGGHTTADGSLSFPRGSSSFSPASNASRSLRKSRFRPRRSSTRTGFSPRRCIMVGRRECDEEASAGGRMDRGESSASGPKGNDRHRNDFPRSFPTLPFAFFLHVLRSSTVHRRGSASLGAAIAERNAMRDSRGPYDYSLPGVEGCRGRKRTPRKRCVSRISDGPPTPDRCAQGKKQPPLVGACLFPHRAVPPRRSSSSWSFSPP